MQTDVELKSMLKNNDDKIFVEVKNIAQRYLEKEPTIPQCEKDDIVQKVLIRFWKKIKARKIKKQKSVQSYIRFMTRTEVFASKRKYFLRKKNHHAYSQKH